MELLDITSCYRLCRRGTIAIMHGCILDVLRLNDSWAWPSMVAAWPAMTVKDVWEAHALKLRRVDGERWADRVCVYSWICRIQMCFLSITRLKLNMYAVLACCWVALSHLSATKTICLTAPFLVRSVSFMWYGRWILRVEIETWICNRSLKVACLLAQYRVVRGTTSKVSSCERSNTAVLTWPRESLLVSGCYDVMLLLHLGNNIGHRRYVIDE